MVLVQQFFDPMVLARGIVKGLRLYKAKEITWLIHSCKLNILRSEILGYGLESLIYMKLKVNL